jgi:hypothetical protein
MLCFLFVVEFSAKSTTRFGLNTFRFKCLPTNRIAYNQLRFIEFVDQVQTKLDGKLDDECLLRNFGSVSILQI